MMTGLSHNTTAAPRWLHRWAVLTVCATFVLLALGAIVTTFRVGMADPVWPSSPLYLFFMSWQEPSPGFIIEHSHRLAGYIVGCCVIVLAVGLWLTDPRRWVRWLGTAALLAVIVQGLLGGFRVVLHALLGPNLAMIHGVFAQVVLALLVGVTAAISPGWVHGSMRAVPDLRKLDRWVVAITALFFTQIVLGAWIRHFSTALGQRLHFLLAFALVAAVVWLMKIVGSQFAEERALVLPACVLSGLVFVQILLGVEAWMLKYASGLPAEMQAVTIGQAIVRTAHVLTGFGILSTSVLLTLRAYRRMGVAEPVVATSVCRLEGAV
jgi:cytochrome c oxidase assembly protein subunit 15